jgi:predicted Rossmann fold flavoprotein
MKSLGIIGAGPAGMMAALEARRLGLDVHLFDSNPRVGRKLQATGAGRCNLSNQAIAASHYSCTDPSFLENVFSAFSQDQLIDALDCIGIPTFATPDGWCYPLSESAANVVDIFEAHLREAGVVFNLQTKICNIQQNKSEFILAEVNNRVTYSFDHVICATGGKATPKLGSTGDLLLCLSRIGHTILPVLPALVPILTDPKPISKMRGVRLDVGIRLLRGQELLGETVGNIIFTEWGINGPGVMDISYLVSKNQGSDLNLEINFLPYHEVKLQDSLNAQRKTLIPLRVILQAILPLKVILQIFEMTGLPQDIQMNFVQDESLDNIFNLIKKFPLSVWGTRSFDFSQISTGGIPISEVHPITMESRIVPGLFFAGEVLDVTGPCGGYNLHWAFTSGVLAGRSAAR